MTSAELCRANGWNVGDVLEVIDKENSVLRHIAVRITAIGEELTLARHRILILGDYWSAERGFTLMEGVWHKVADSTTKGGG